MSEPINPPGWPRPSGYSNGIVATGRFLAISGQIGWNERNELVSGEFLAQAAQALRNVVAVLAEAGARAEHVVRLTWYVTDKREYLAAQHEIGVVYREVMGRHFPAMSVVAVSALLEDEAKVEIEATAVIPR